MSEWIIGRAPNCAVVVDVAKVSRYHAKLILTPAGMTIEDMNSSSGTTLNGVKVSGPTPIKAGDVIHVGKIKLRTDIGVLGEIFGGQKAMQPMPNRDIGPVPGAARSQGPNGTAIALIAVLILLAGATIVVLATRDDGDGPSNQANSKSIPIGGDSVEKKELNLAVQLITLRTSSGSGCCTGSVYKVENDKLYLATNAHCLGIGRFRGGSYELWIQLFTKMKLRVSHFALETSGKDLARLVVPAGDAKEGKDFVIVSPNPKLELKKMDTLVTAGFPGCRRDPTIGQGILQSFNCVHPKMKALYTTCLNTDAQINKGNSGGPLFVEKNKGSGDYEWVGINTWMNPKEQQQGFAIPIKFFVNGDFEEFSADSDGARQAAQARHIPIKY